MPDEPAIFISYRRRDAGGHGRNLDEYLRKRFGKDRIFFDRDTIESGDVFPDRLRQGVEGCAVLLALIGPEWLEVRGEDGNRRLDDANDFVHREIALALEQGKKVIPVLFDDTPVPPRDRLPDPLKALANCDALTLRGKTYEYHTQRRELVRLLAKVPGVPLPLPEAPQADTNRDRMLAEVRRVWIDGYLKHSLETLVPIALGLEETPDAVSGPWDLIVQQPDRMPRPLPPAQAMSAIFDELGQALLILGAPGAGKTTLLLELARDLLDRAMQDAAHLIPVVFHLSSWAVRRRPLADWLVDELAERYYVPRKLAQAWIDAEQVLPLLDGLDEVAPEHRAACVEVINTFRRQQPLVPLAVCSRVAEYDTLPVRVALSGAVLIRPLSREQIRTYLKQAGRALAGVRWVLRDDETLWELLETPLMLSIVALAFGLGGGLLFGLGGGLVYGLVYGQIGGLDRITPAETLQWSWSRLLFGLLFGGLLFGLIGGLIGGLVNGLLFGLLLGLGGGLLGGLVNGLIGGLVSGLTFGLFFGLTADQLVMRTIPNEGIRLSLRNALISLLTSGLTFGLIFGLILEQVAGLLIGLLLGLFHGLNYGGFAYLMHYVLRFLLWYKDYAPWNYIRFLDHAAERVFLRKIGGGYIFTHRLLMEYFATLQLMDQVLED